MWYFMIIAFRSTGFNLNKSFPIKNIPIKKAKTKYPHIDGDVNYLSLTFNAFKEYLVVSKKERFCAMVWAGVNDLYIH